MIKIVKGVLRSLGVNRAVFYSVLLQAWNIFAVPATMLIIAHWLSAEEQGFYYTFSSILALQIFVEMGLSTVILQVASHEWAFLELDASGRIRGNTLPLSRLASLLRFALRWYAVCGLIVAVGVGIGGFLFFNATPHPGITWQVPWLSLCIIAGLALFMSPVFSLIEGCNQVSAIYRFRLIQGVISSVAVMAGFVFGAGLFVPMISAMMRFLCGIIFVLLKYRRFFTQLINCVLTNSIKWWTEVWPFQWRIGISWFSGYFIFFLFTPVMFHYHGAKVAGQTGMTLALVTAVGAFANTWVSTRMPQFGVLIARREYAALDKLFRHLLIIAMCIVILGSAGLWVLIFWTHRSGLVIGERLLPMLPATLFLAQGILNVFIGILAFYLRAHKYEPMMISSLVGAVSVGLSTWLLGWRFGPVGAATGFFAVAVIWGVPSTIIVFRKCRRQWHSGDVPVSIGYSAIST